MNSPEQQTLTTQQALELALQHQNAGRLSEAESIYQQILQTDPNQPDALHLLGVIAHQVGNNDVAFELITKALTINPENAGAHSNLGAALKDLGRLDEAMASYQKALDIKPDFAEAHFNLANTLKDLGQFEAAAAGYQKGLAVNPNHAGGHGNLGIVLKELGRLDEAAACHKKALSINPDHAEAHSNLGNILQEQGRPEEAAASFEKALAIKPDFAEAHSNLGNALRDLERPDDAIACYEKALAINPDYAQAHSNLGAVLNTQGRYDKALASQQRALAINPDYAGAHNNIGNTYTDLGLSDEAIASFERALEIKPDYAEAYLNLGLVLGGQGRREEAAAIYQKALSINPDFAKAHNNLGNLYNKMLRHDDAVASFKKALALEPDFAEAHSNLLFSLNYFPGITGEAIVEEARRWGAQHGYRGEIPEHQNTPDPDRRLAVGYVSADFREHAALYYLEPLLANHDRDAVEVFCYAEVRHPDRVTERYQGIADHWRPTVGMGDAELADMIRQDGIDILVDCTGHTGNNRLPALTRKPAPVQVNYFPIHGRTSGVDVMDYVLSDAILSPPGDEDHFSEEAVLLPQGCVGFRPDPDWPDVAPARESGDGRVFVCVGDPARIGDEAISIWTRLLNTVEGARILFKHRTFNDPKACEVWRRAFKALDGRADFEGLPGGWKKNMDIYDRVDVVLDVIPISGGSSCLIPLWMGVPVVTLGGRNPAHRFGATLVTHAGMPELLATDPEDYLNIAAGLIQDRERLASLRRTLRDTINRSPLRDERGRARDIEAAYRKMWQTWCERITGP